MYTLTDVWFVSHTFKINGTCFLDGSAIFLPSIIMWTVNTVEPPNKGHYGDNDLSFVGRSVPISEVK